MFERLRVRLNAEVPRVRRYVGELGTLWMAGPEVRSLTWARVVCGEDVRKVSQGRGLRRLLPAWAEREAARGAFAYVVRGAADAAGEEAVEVPLVVYQGVDLPETHAELKKFILHRVNRDNLRRIRKAGFDYRVTTAGSDFRLFYHEFYLPFISSRHGEEALIYPEEKMERLLDSGGELVCVERDGACLAGSFNVAYRDHYAMGWLGLRGGDPDGSLRHLGVISALYMRSMERAVESRLRRFAFGKSLPFLGPGSARFKANWGGVLQRDPQLKDTARVYCDLCHVATQKLLKRQPMVFREGEELAAVRWVEDVADAEAAAYDAKRFAGIERWYVICPVGAVSQLRGVLREMPQLGVVEVDPAAGGPLWLGKVIAPLRVAPSSPIFVSQ